MRTAVAAPAPEPLHQEIADLIGAWLSLRVERELASEQVRCQTIVLDRERRLWWRRVIDQWSGR